MIDAVTLRVVTELRGAGIEPILLKGPSLAAWLYDDHTPRPYVDSDLLVSAASAPAAYQVLSGLGYACDPVMPGPEPHATTWRHPLEGVEVDLHIRLPLTDEEADTWGCLEHHTAWLTLGSTQVRVLDAPAKALHVVIHALQNSMSAEQPNTDLRRALAAVPDTEWLEAAQLAAELGAADAFAVGLCCVPDGAALCQRIGISASSSLPTTVRLLADGSAGSGAGALDHLSQLSGWRSRARFLAKKILPPESYVRSPDIAGAGRPALKVVAYAHYWLRLLRKAPGALRVWYSTRA